MISFLCNCSSCRRDVKTLPYAFILSGNCLTSERPQQVLTIDNCLVTIISPMNIIPLVISPNWILQTVPFLPLIKLYFFWFKNAEYCSNSIAHSFLHTADICCKVVILPLLKKTHYISLQLQIIYSCIFLINVFWNVSKIYTSKNFLSVCVQFMQRNVVRRWIPQEVYSKRVRGNLALILYVRERGWRQHLPNSPQSVL